MTLDRRMRLALADREAVQPVVGFGPPAIEDRTVQAAVKHDFLSAGTRGLERTTRRVQPDINALHEVSPDVDVVVLDKENLAGEAWIAHQAGDLLQDVLAGTIA